VKQHSGKRYRARSNSKANGTNGAKSNGSETPQPEVKYTDQGFLLFSRKWMGRELARHPGAFVVYFHLVAWANHEDGELRRGQLALGERDFGIQIGMSVLTVRKWLRWLRDKGWIKLEPMRHGPDRGTIVTVLRYDEAQRYKSYAIPAGEQDEIFIPKPLPPSATIARSLPN
jgi:hypothetical protein